MGTNRYPETNTAVRKRKPQATDHATAGHAVVAPHAVLLARDGHSCPIRDIVSDGTFVAAANRVRVWLTRKLAERIDGVDLSERQVGDVLELSPRDASLLMAEGHAEPDRRARVRGSAPEALRGGSDTEDAG